MLKTAEGVEAPTVRAWGRCQVRRADSRKGRNLEVGSELRERESRRLRRCVHKRALRNKDRGGDMDGLVDVGRLMDCALMNVCT